MSTPDRPFTTEDFDQLSAFVIEAWTSGLDRDWSVPAGFPSPTQRFRITASRCTNAVNHAGSSSSARAMAPNAVVGVRAGSESR